MAQRLEEIAITYVIILIGLAIAGGSAWWLFGHDSVRYLVGTLALVAYGLTMLFAGSMGTYFLMSKGGALVASANEIQGKSHLADAQLVRSIVQSQLELVRLQQKAPLSLENNPSMELFQPNHFFVSSDSNLN
jgi:hypothetical protein